MSEEIWVDPAVKMEPQDCEEFINTHAPIEHAEPYIYAGTIDQDPQLASYTKMNNGFYDRLAFDHIKQEDAERTLISDGNGNYVFAVKNEILSDFHSPAESHAKHPCDFCRLSFDTQTNLYEHNLTHLSVALNKLDCVRCVLCDISIKTDQLKRHMRTHYKSDKSCPLCEKPLKGRLDKHLARVHYAKNTFVCAYCYKHFKYKYNLYSHISRIHKTIRNTKRFGKTCNVCGKVLGCKYSLKSHVALIHGSGDAFSATVFECRECGKTFGSHSYLHKHMRRVHIAAGNPDPCPHCGKLVKYLREHLRTHGMTDAPKRRKTPGDVPSNEGVGECKKEINVSDGGDRIKFATNCDYEVSSYAVGIEYLDRYGDDTMEIKVENY